MYILTYMSCILKHKVNKASSGVQTYVHTCAYLQWHLFYENFKKKLVKIVFTGFYL